ncbi:hypothetical protein PMAYCL1PPCAC_14884, partial [Pristionchus mayeri]
FHLKLTQIEEIPKNGNSYLQSHHRDEEPAFGLISAHVHANLPAYLWGHHIASQRDGHIFDDQKNADNWKAVGALLDSRA